jgi:phosphatidate cytidylyltransferase
MALTKGITRIIYGFAIGIFALFAMIAGGIPLALLCLVIVVLGSKEYTQILKNKGFLPSYKIIIASSFLFAVLAYFDRMDLLPLAFTLSTFMAFMWVLFRGKQPYIANVATTILGFVYCGWFPLHLLLLLDIGCCEPVFNGFIKHNVSSEGALYCLLILLAVTLTDSFCYYTGVQFGKHKLAEVISPNKTIEGSIGGSLMGIAFVMTVGSFMQMEWYQSLILGILIVAFAQIGDLCESMIKRDASVKDSSDIIPGHGGFLDRTDSYILTIPVVYYYLQFFVQNNFLDILKGLF